MTFWFWKQLIRIIKKKKKDFTLLLCFHIKKKKKICFLLFPNSFFLFISHSGLWLKHIWKRRTKPGPIIRRRTSCLPLKGYKNKFGLLTGIQGDFHTALSFHVSLLTCVSHACFSTNSCRMGDVEQQFRFSLQSS